jgi:hypothetical protein
MIETAPNTTAPSVTETSQSEPLADCQSFIVCLEGGRFVIVRVDEDPFPTLRCEDKPDLRDLAAGDIVDYQERNLKVRAVEVYR